MKQQKKVFFKAGILLLSLFLLPGLLGCGAISSLMATPTPTATSTPTTTPTPTATSTPTITPTPTSSPTITPTSTPTPNPFSRQNLKKIILQEADVLNFMSDIGFAYSMETVRITPDIASWKFSIIGTLPGLVTSHQQAFEVNYIPSSPNSPIYKATIQNTILVFNSSQDAHRFFLEDTEEINPTFVRNAGRIPAIGDETTAIRAWRGGYWPVGIVIWRYEQVYVFLHVLSISDYTQQALFDLARTIQQRIEDAMVQK